MLLTVDSNLDCRAPSLARSVFRNCKAESMILRASLAPLNVLTSTDATVFKDEFCDVVPKNEPEALSTTENDLSLSSVMKPVDRALLAVVSAARVAAAVVAPAALSLFTVTKPALAVAVSASKMSLPVSLVSKMASPLAFSAACTPVLEVCSLMADTAEVRPSGVFCDVSVKEIRCAVPLSDRRSRL